MDKLKTKIIEEGRVLGSSVLKVDSFLNHQLDVAFLNEIGKEFKEVFKDKEITKILTAEVSGIAIAAIAGLHFQVPVVFAKKTQSLNLDKDTYEGEVYSYTKEQHFKIRVSRRYLSKEDKVLILDDFLANGEALKGLRDIVEAAGATLQGAGVVIEKGFQQGGDQLRSEGMDIRALATISSMEEGNITFR
ncbi:xanthine phosphoribosyltransferase [Proteiniclasticum sp. SCR006]|uniref:Xanthine phosphoribosyltransferase n=1 Tax=Proteiniclasticum aestuarii TaxID=2817862 RepID=A0A939HAF6_9CLOT|nr:xanthine phosphoribosyltransferase [Proteiniclasticum aestuarii]MBO1266151.1 xanthine phosphoribosyltransferase [Proteiniclasticum aestuarii]